MGNAVARAMNLIFGRWRSQLLCAGAELSFFDHLRPIAGWRRSAGGHPETCPAPPRIRRLIGAQPALGLLIEDQDRVMGVTISLPLTLNPLHPTFVA